MIIENKISYYDMIETCLQVNISTSTLIGWRKRKLIKKPIRIGSKNYYTETDIAEIKKVKYNLHHRGIKNA